MARGLTPYTSTQENAWLVLAARALSKETLTLDIDGAPVKTAVYRSYKAEAMAGKPVKITNTGDAPVQAVVSVSGSPVTPEPAASNGFKIERNYFTLDGKPADVSKAKQNDRFAVVLKITEAKPEYGHIMVSDYLPAGPRDRQPASGVVGRLAARWTGSRMARSRRIPSSATTASRRRSIAPATTSRCSRWPMSCARYRPANTCCRRLCRGHVQPLALRPHRHRHGRGASGEMSETGDHSVIRHARA